MFLLFVILTAAIGAGALVLAYHRSGDLFHPLVITGPMMVTLYALLPLMLLGDDALTSFFTDQDLLFVAVINLLGVASFCWGCLAAAGRKKIPLSAARHFQMSLAFRQRVFVGGAALGFVGLGAYALTIVNVGGFYQAYSQAYSGGWSDSGYVRDAVSLCVPGIVFVLVSRTRKKIKFAHAALCLLFALPFVVQGLLGARRGPTFLVFAAGGICWYMAQARRPRLVVFVIAGISVGVLMLFLVSNRENIYLGSEWNMDKSILDYLKVENPENGTGNEFIYGGGSVLHASISEEFYWGRRYFAEVFVRPIPRQLWPDKYADIGLARLEANAGTGGEDFSTTLGWSGAFGAAPGMVADVWLEFWWFAFAALFGIGWVYGRAWRRACERGGFAIVIYVFLVSLSVFLVFQTMEAILVRFLFMAGSSWLVWRWASAARMPFLRKPKATAAARRAAFRPAAVGATSVTPPPHWRPAAEADEAN